MHSELTTPHWDDKASAAVSLTFDLDAESSLLALDDAYNERLTSLSESRYGITRGVPRILDLLASDTIHATFYVPGQTAERHPAAIEAILAAGHEVGHHGHRHLRSDKIDAADQRREIELGLAALARFGIVPSGYRSPAWELTPSTFALLVEYGFRYDSSCMGDDRPYCEQLKELAILELPVHWSLVDSSFFSFSLDEGGYISPTEALLATWQSEFESTRQEHRHLTLTMHPEIIGRGHRTSALARLVRRYHDDGAMFITHAALADAVAAANPQHPLFDAGAGSPQTPESST
jgi:peptidoglycan-N-acetylglucosamine deacetylase